ncbi:MAG: ATP-binding protein [Pseudohongiellaceae bacterium]
MSYSPKILINFSLLLAAALLLIDLSAILYPPYTGIRLAQNNTTAAMQVVRMDSWVAEQEQEQELELGDVVVAISNRFGVSLPMGPQYSQVLASDVGEYFPSRNARIEGYDEVYQLLRDSPVTLHLADGREITYELNQQRPLSALPVNTWVLIILGISVPVMASLVWAWQPNKPEARFLLVSGIGFFLINFTAVFSIYNLEMFFPPAILHWLSRIMLDMGQLLFAAFGTAVLLYYPNKLQFADRAARFITGFAILYPAVIYLTQYISSGFGAGEYPGFRDLQTAFHEIMFFCITLYLCWRQFRVSSQLPVQRAQVLWVILAWTVGPGIYILFRVVPRLFGVDPLLETSLAMNLVIATTYIMVLIGVARFDLFHLEQHIGQAYQWVLVSLGFFGLDFLLVSLGNLSASVASAIVIAAVLWAYLPIRQWVHQRYLSDRLARIQILLDEAVILMIKDLLNTKSIPRRTWQRVIDYVFKPGNVREIDPLHSSRLSERGQQLLVQGNLHSPALCLEFADSGERLFTRRDIDLVTTLSLLFEKLYDVRDAFLAGQAQERNRIRRDLHDQISHKLLSLIYSAKDSKARQLAQDTMAQLSELIQALKHEPIHLADLASRIHTVCEDACMDSELNLEWHATTSGSDHQLTSDQYLNILNIIRELLSNTIKHSEADGIRVKLQFNDPTLCIEYSDDGNGFSQKAVKPGNGLFNLQVRSEELKAKMEWNTSSGTSVTLHIPVFMGRKLDV